MFKSIRTKKTLFLICISKIISNSPLCQAEWVLELDNALYYTDDVSLFSVTRRVSLEEDPTQPVVEEPGQGGDFVYEPNAVLSFEHPNSYGTMLIRADAGAYVFFDKTKFTHGFYQLQLGQLFETGTRIKFIYDLIPNMLIDFNEPNKNDEHVHHLDSFEERLTSHIWIAHLDQKVDDRLSMRLLGRYGLRNYQEPFQHRDTRFWTIGTHLVWELYPGIELMMGYHYEVGDSDHEANTLVHDDISYINHYFSTELSFVLLPDLVLNLIFDYDHNNFTSENIHDLHHQAHENIFQGEIELVYEMNMDTNLILGWQHGQRKFNIEPETIINNNIWLEIEYTFHL